jgi:death on curing protein
MTIVTLSTEDVLQIHEILVQDFAESGDPISPPGVKSLHLLESAVSRQYTAHGNTIKYPDPLSNAATLAYGLCNNHPFYNGNKRTALVSMLVHLDKNKITMFHTSQNDLYDMIIGVADHSLGLRKDPRKREQHTPQRRVDDEIEAFVYWLSRRVDKVVRGEKQIRYRQLRNILQRFEYFMENPHKNSIDIVKYEERMVGIIRKRKEREKIHVGTIGYPGDNIVMTLNSIKQVRRMCRLTESDGVDSDSFYNEAATVDAFINKYRTALRKLAKR